MRIAQTKVMMFSKSWCPHCTSAKDLLRDKSVRISVLELDKRSDGDQLQTALQAKSGQRTVPNIYINGDHIGGFTQLQEAD